MPVLRRILACLLCAAGVASARLPEPVEAALAQAQLPREALGAIVLPVDGGPAPWQHRAAQPMPPASTVKLVTAVAALSLLGPGWRGETALLADAAPAGGRLRGTLYLRGRGDTDFDFAALWDLLRGLRDRGVRDWTGDLVVDREWFRPARADRLAPPFDEGPEWPYNTVPDALGLNAALLRFEWQSDADGRVQARSDPVLPDLLVLGVQRPSGRDCEDWEADWQPPIVHPLRGRVLVLLRGGFPPGCSAAASLNVVDRQWVLQQAVRRFWHELGGHWRGAAREGRTPGGAVVLGRHAGRPLAQTLHAVLKRSDNPLARTLFLTLGATAAAADEDTLPAARRRVRDWLQAQGIGVDGLVLDNGAGLSRATRVQPRQLAALLQQAWAGPRAPELLAALPVAGEDGTLQRRLRDSPAAGRARLKTGSLRDAAALAGYVPDAAGRWWVVVAFVQHPQAPVRGRPVLDALVDWVARQAR
jgi:D-alanyl-D-alanine carboxypeptidase/D-alanyl-D-alanine-endopeptidase (penicillin-binding protein 4)